MCFKNSWVQKIVMKHNFFVISCHKMASEMWGKNLILELLLLRFVWIFRPNDPICDIFVYLQTMLIPEPKIIKKVLWVKWFSKHNYFKQWISQKNRNLLIQWVFQIQFIVFNLVWLIIKHICSVLFLIIFGFLNIFMDRVQFERLLLKPSYSDWS